VGYVQPYSQRVKVALIVGIQIPFGQAIRELDYVGMILFTGAAALILTGIVYSTFTLSSDLKVLVTLGTYFRFNPSLNTIPGN